MAFLRSAASQFPRYAQLGLGAWDSRCGAAGRGLCSGFKENYHLQGNVGWLCGFIQQKDPRFYTVLGMVRTWGHEGKGEMEMTIKGDPRCSGG